MVRNFKSINQKSSPFDMSENSSLQNVKSTINSPTKKSRNVAEKSQAQITRDLARSLENHEANVVFLQPYAGLTRKELEKRKKENIRKGEKALLGLQVDFVYSFLLFFLFLCKILTRLGKCMKLTTSW